MNENKMKLTDEMIEEYAERIVDNCDGSPFTFVKYGAEFSRKFYEELLTENPSEKKSVKYKPFNLEDCINNYDKKAILFRP